MVPLKSTVGITKPAESVVAAGVSEAGAVSVAAGADAEGEAVLPLVLQANIESAMSRARAIASTFFIVFLLQNIFTLRQ